MCGPAAGAVAAWASVVLSAASIVQQKNNNEALADNEQKQLAIRAEDASARGAIEADRHRAQVRKIIGAQRAAMASSGAQLNGSFDNMLEETATLGELDAKQIQQNALREAWGYKSAAATSRLQAKLNSNALLFKGAGTLLTGVSNAYSMTRDYNGGGTVTAKGGRGGAAESMNFDN